MGVWWDGKQVKLQATLAFLRAAASSGTVDNDQLKMMVLGRSEAGKTSMINALVQNSSRLTRVGDRTVGIDQHILNMDLEHTGNERTDLRTGDKVEWIESGLANEDVRLGMRVKHEGKEYCIVRGGDGRFSMVSRTTGIPNRQQT